MSLFRIHQLKYIFKTHLQSKVMENKRTIRKVTSGELITEQAKINILLYIKYTYTLKLLLNVVTAGTEALSVSGNKFLYA
jgi:uncharacterized protein with ParB-like and HNH nuclease domain